MPPVAPRIVLAKRDDVSVTENDEHGNALGGIRSPFVDVPLFRYAVHTGPGPFCILSGNETSLGGDVLTSLYGDEDGYWDVFTASLDKTIKAGFLLELDRKALLDTQAAGCPSGVRDRLGRISSPRVSPAMASLPAARGPVQLTGSQVSHYW